MKKLILNISIANAQGNGEKQLVREQRSLKHSKFTPTGIFVLKGSKITIKLLKNNISLFSIFIGQWGIYQKLNNGQSISPKEYVIKAEEQTIISDLEGMLYLTNESETNNYEVLISAEAEIENPKFVASTTTSKIYSPAIEITIEKAIEVPTFVIGNTTNQEFKQMLHNNLHSPFVEIIGKHVFGTFQMQIARDLWIDEEPNNYNINETFIRLDKIYELSNIVSGLDLNYDGSVRKASNKIQIANPDTGAGYASATHYHITFQNDSGAGKGLFTKKPDNGWSIWHEIGHTYQNSNYKWNGLTEVTGNIHALWVERELGFENNLIKTRADKDIKNFIFDSNPDKNFDEQSLFTKLGLFWQLDQAYGKWFYPNLNQAYRLLDSNLLPINDSQKKQLFIEMTSKVANQNLIPFFEKWGIKADENTETIVSKYPKLTKEIWNNIFDGHYDENAIVEHQLPNYQPVQGVKVTVFLEKTIGDEISINELKEKIIMQNNLEIKKINSISYRKPIFLDEKSIDGDFIVIDKNQQLVPNKYQILVKLNLENSILLEGIGYDWGQYRAIINLNKTKKTFFIGGNSDTFHYYFKNQSYIKITIKDDKGNSIYKKIAEGQDSSLIFDDINEIKYKNNYMIIFWFAEPKRGLYFDPTIKAWIPSIENYVKFVVNDNRLIKKYKYINTNIVK